MQANGIMSRTTVPQAVQAAAERLAAATRAEAVVLFGSRARGDAREGSDWDLCVLLPDDVRPGQATSVTLWRLVADLPAALQVVPVRRSVFIAKRHDPNSLIHDVAEDGIALVGALPT